MTWVYDLRRLEGARAVSALAATVPGVVQGTPMVTRHPLGYCSLKTNQGPSYLPVVNYSNRLKTSLGNVNVPPHIEVDWVTHPPSWKPEELRKPKY
jgi:hypothetical protein